MKREKWVVQDDKADENDPQRRPVARFNRCNQYEGRKAYGNSQEGVVTVGHAFEGTYGYYDAAEKHNCRECQFVT